MNMITTMTFGIYWTTRNTWGYRKPSSRTYTRGVAIAREDPEALLLFSGGQTRKSASPRSEAFGYYLVADHFNWWNVLHLVFVDESQSSSTSSSEPGISHVRIRAITEEYARDSLENLMFSMCRFREMTGHYPEKITLISFSFKRDRFENFHRKALRFPQERFSLIGIDPPEDAGFDLPRLQFWEKTAALGPFKRDPCGCQSKDLLQKRKERNPFARTPPYQQTCPEMEELLSFCGPEIYPKECALPWDQSGSSTAEGNNINARWCRLFETKCLEQE